MSCKGHIYSPGTNPIFNVESLSNIQLKYAIDKRAESIYSDVEIITSNGRFEDVDAIIVTSIRFYEEIEKMLSTKVSFPIILLNII